MANSRHETQTFRTSFIFLTSAAARVVLGVRVGVPSLNLGREVHAQAILYVDANASGPAHDGSSWCNAYLELAPGLRAASAGTTIRVADGEYYPDTAGFPNPRQASFQIKNGVTLEGGYAGCDAPVPIDTDTIRKRDDPWIFGPFKGFPVLLWHGICQNNPRAQPQLFVGERAP